MRFKTVILLSFLLCSGLSFYSTYALNIIVKSTEIQKDDILDIEKLESLKNNEDYNYNQEDSQTNWWTDFKEWLAIQWERVFGEPFEPNSLWGMFFEILPYIIIAIALILIVWFIAKNNPGNQIMRQHQNSKVILNEEEELLMKRNLDKLSEDAINQKQYRLAVRYLYLNCIKRLDIKNIIGYANDKTNYEYVKEIQFSEISKPFKTLTLAYEQIWYGQLVFDDMYFEKFKHEYDNFHQKLDQKVYAQA